MNTASENPAPDDLDNRPEVDAFSTSLAPINRTGKFLFGLRDRIGCVSLLVAFVALMRLFISK